MKEDRLCAPRSGHSSTHGSLKPNPVSTAAREVKQPFLARNAGGGPGTTTVAYGMQDIDRKPVESFRAAQDD